QDPGTNNIKADWFTVIGDGALHCVVGLLVSDQIATRFQSTRNIPVVEVTADFPLERFFHEPELSLAIWADTAAETHTIPYGYRPVRLRGGGVQADVWQVVVITLVPLKSVWMRFNEVSHLPYSLLLVPSAGCTADFKPSPEAGQVGRESTTAR